MIGFGQGSFTHGSDGNVGGSGGSGDGSGGTLMLSEHYCLGFSVRAGTYDVQKRFAQAGTPCDTNSSAR
jgi:hypothetical protein